MKTNVAYIPFFVLLYAGLLPMAAGQNLVPNPSFETYTQCPIGFGPGGPLDAPPWLSATEGTIDYFHPCSNPSVVGVPDNAFGSQAPRTGTAYAGGFFSMDMTEYREYLLVQLTQPLLPGKTYYVSFYVSLGGLGCGIQSIGALFTPDLPPSAGSGTLNYAPQFETNMGFISDTSNWVLIGGCFTAEGGEQFMTIGNFNNILETSFDPLCTNFTAASYYYIDDVSVIESPPGDIPFELGGPVVACDSFEIDPGLGDVNYFWPDGSHGPSLTVTTSGTYILTVSSGCESGVDGINVTVNNPAPVEIIPDAYTMCSGEVFTISLDPDAGAYTWHDGSSDPVYNITSGGVYQVTLDDGCDLTTDEVTVTTIDEPEFFSLGPDTVLCAGEEIEFYFDPSLGDFEWQDNNTNNVYLIQDEGNYSLTISNMCGEEIDVIEVTFAPAPYVSLGQDQEGICEGDTVDISFFLDTDMGSYVWQDGSTTSDYHISSTGLYSVTVSNECGMAADTLSIVQIGVPVVDLEDSLSLCPGDTIVLHGNGLSGNYIWQDNSTGHEFEVAASGTYSLTITNSCGSGSDSVMVNSMLPLQAPDLGPDFSLCPGDVAILDVEIAGATITWQDMSTADIMLVDTVGTYHVMVSNGCQSVADTVIVTVENIPPAINLPDQMALCQGFSDVLDPGLEGVTYIWNNGSPDPTLVVNAPGIYSLTVTNGCGVDMDTVNILDGGPGPIVSLGPDISLCTGDAIQIIPLSSNVNAWLWPDGSINASFSTSSAGLVYVEAANSCGMAYDTMVITLLPRTPALALGPDIDLCPGTITSLTITEPDVDVVWSDGSTGNSYQVTDNDMQVYASITNGCGLSADTVDVAFLPAIPTLDLGTDQSLCPGEVISFDPAITDVDYLWQDGSMNATFQTTEEITVVLTISNYCGSSTDTVVVTESTNSPQVDLGPDVTGCEGGMITIPSGISGVSYMWQDGSVDMDYVATTSGWVYLMVSNLCGADTDSLWVSLSELAPAPDLGPDTSLCEGTTLLLFADVSASNPIEWQDGSTEENFVVTSAGIYSLTESNQCGSTTDEIAISYVQLPSPFSLGSDTSMCPGESFELFAPQTSNTITWQDGSTQTVHIADQPQTYFLHISNACGVVSDSVVVTEHPIITYVNLTASKRLCPGDELTLDASQSVNASYVWNTGEEGPSIVVSSPGTYAVEVVGPCNTAFGQVEVIAMRDCSGDVEIFIPNIFSPNGDQINDKFSLSFGDDVQLMSIEGSIYDRWGNQVFTSNALPFEWDGRFNGERAMPGVYVYQLKVSFTAGGEERVEVFKGDVTVVK